MSSLDSTKTPTKDGVDYIASKAAINTFAKTFSLSYPEIRFISLLFPWIDTSSIREMNPEYLKEEMDRYGQTKLLTSEYVADYIFNVIISNIETGSIIEVDYD
jgi:NAD(P)-dependent dehydrogenase (short-subunit alcohol dehydrogenase family)